MDERKLPNMLPNVNHECDSRVGRLMNALSDGLCSGGDRALAVKIISSIKEQIVLEPVVTPSAIDLVEAFLNSLGTNLAKLVDALECNIPLDEEVIKEIQEAARAWEFFGRIND